MSARWLSTLVRARQAQRDVAHQDLAAARRADSLARAEAWREAQRLDSLVTDVPTEQTATAFVAASAAVQAAAAVHSAAAFAMARAELATAARHEALLRAALACSTVERLEERHGAAEQAALARQVQQELDEIAARCGVVREAAS